MTDLPAPSSDSPLDEVIGAVLAQADEIATLDAARAEAWASDVLAFAAEWGVDDDALLAALVEDGGHRAAVGLAALAGLIDTPPASPGGTRPLPEWAAAIGTSRCEGAWALRIGGAESLAFRFVDAADVRHVITVDLVAGDPETVGEVIVGPGDLLDALHEDDADIESEHGGPALLAARCVSALRATVLPTASTVANGRLLIRRMEGLTEVDVAPPVQVDIEIPEPPERDPDDDAYAREILVRALGPVGASASAAVVEVAELVAPSDMEPLSPGQRDAVLILEWADWLGAVIGLVRAGERTAVDGAVMVDMVNRCPEVTSTIPKADRSRIEWAFDTMIEPWGALGLVTDEGLTALGVEVLPAALHRAWSDQRTER